MQLLEIPYFILMNFVTNSNKNGWKNADIQNYLIRFLYVNYLTKNKYSGKFST